MEHVEYLFAGDLYRLMMINEYCVSYDQADRATQGLHLLVDVLFIS